MPGIILGAFIFGTAGYLSASDLIHSVASPALGCNIKGNISLNTGEPIYHIPGQEYYRETRISLQRGERWFCSEEEARAAGWRKARN